jgi:hypothetical protein
MSKDFADGKANLMEIIKQKERETVLLILPYKFLYFSFPY